VYNAKRLIGRSLSEVRADVTLAAMPHRFGPVPPPSSSSPSGADVEDGHHAKQLAGFVITTAGGQKERVVSPVDVAVHVVASLKSAVDIFLGYSIARKVVIAAPAEFNTSQRVQTAKAFERAGFKVVAMLNEPTAAALAYGLDKQEHVHYVLVYDFGGGTLDASLLWNYHGSMDVLSSDGDSALGGSDFDACMFNLLRDKLELREHGGGGGDGRERSERIEGACSDSELREHAEHAKRELSGRTEVSVVCGRGRGAVVNMTRAEFEGGCARLFARALDPVARLLEESNVARSEVDEVVLVGGSTRIPKVRAQLKEFFGGRAPRADIDPDLAVAVGCAQLD
jgi:molecular chaperone DnaK (HSP70)